MLSIDGGVLGTRGELVQTVRLWPLWGFMSWQDIRQRYRGSLLGPFWIAGGVAAASLGAGFLYSRVLKTPTHELVPFVAVGIALWTFISLTLIEACHSFTSAAALIRSAALPRPVHVLRTVSRNLIVFAHNIPVIGLVLLITGHHVGLEALWSLVGLALLVVNLLWTGWVLALLSARFRDIIQLTTYGLQFMAFITPIFWFPELAGRGFGLLRFNPFYHWLETLRGPLLGRPPSLENWLVCGGMALVGVALALFTFHRHRDQIALWV